MEHFIYFLALARHFYLHLQIPKHLHQFSCHQYLCDDDGGGVKRGMVREGLVCLNVTSLGLHFRIRLGDMEHFA